MKQSILLFAFPVSVLTAVMGCSDDEEASNTTVGGAAGTAQTGGAAPGGTTQVTVQGGAASQAGAAALAGYAGLGAQAGAGQEGSNFRAVCYSDTDCAGKAAPLCLKEGAAPTASEPGICTMVNCTSEMCGEAFDCCNCSGSVVGAKFPTPTCFPLAGVATVTALGCTCT